MAISSYKPKQMGFHWIKFGSRGAAARTVLLDPGNRSHRDLASATPHTVFTAADASAPESPVDSVSKPGDLWILGNHKLLCSDVTQAEDVERLLSGV